MSFLIGHAADQLKLQPPIAIIPSDGFNLRIEDHLTSHHVVVKVDPPVHNWFAGRFTHLPTDTDVTIGLSMDGMDSPGSKGDVSKWQDLHSVMTYADPKRYETYEWFQQDDQGNWISGDPFKQGNAKFAGDGRIPKQSVIPQQEAERFLSADGKYWSAWREVDNAESVPNLNVFRIHQRFSLPQATVAMRVPYTYTYQQAFLRRLQHANLPGVFIDDIGMTHKQHALQIVRLEPPSRAQAQHPVPTILLYPHAR